MTAAVRSDIGLIRTQNEDSAWYDEKTGLFAVADGMGGHLAGEVASAMAVDAIRHMAEEKQKASFSALSDAFDKANAAILDHAEQHAECRGMGTTLSVLWVLQEKALIAHMGDSRIYRLRDGKLEQVTRDHSLVQELVQAGIITKEEARVHPRRNIITRALGTEWDNQPDLILEDCRPGDCWLLCSDGLTGMVTDDAIADVLNRQAPEEAADTLVRLALEAGGQDNITLIICREEDETWNRD
ncbi:MAG: Stp1/IreP family PP2C-type Ser/Thr phosphatase [Clostridia bacterium]|nr:Stp1/IreP family PP2C-type Ser/Thr phosphatase [Clostridia bacterium]